MKRALVAALAGFVLASSLGIASAQAPPARQSLTLATWNLGNLSRETGAGPTPRTAADYARLRTYARALNADSVALREVDGLAAARRLFDARSWDFHFAARRPGGQGVGFAWRQGLEIVPQPDVDELAFTTALRPGADVFVALNGRRLRLLNVHLKSGCPAGPLYSDTNEPCSILHAQLAVVERWMEARAAEGLPFVVLGDFNRSLRSHDPAWVDSSDGEPAESALTDPGATALADCWQLGWVDFIDHIFFSRTAAGWIVRGSWRLVPYAPEDRRHMDGLSDHCPLTVTME